MVAHATLEDLDLHLGPPGQPDDLGGVGREVENAPAVRAAVVHPDDDGAAGLEVGHPQHRVEREPRAGARELAGVEDLAVGGALAGEAGAVPAGLAREAAATAQLGRRRAPDRGRKPRAPGALSGELARDVRVDAL